MRRHLRTHAPHPQTGSPHDTGDPDDDDSPAPAPAPTPRAPQHRQHRSAPTMPSMPPIVQAQPPPQAPPQPPQQTTPPAPNTSYAQYQMQQQAMLAQQVPMRPHSQPQLQPHAAGMLHSQPPHHGAPGMQMPQYGGYSTYTQYPGYAPPQHPGTPDPTRWLPGAGMQGGQHDYMPR
ncbi:hypothetical protein EXIGLDRAFT_464094 [Exidia glandulosa HHB12029]|uniref:Uncharacterized protein n=1 Tax=Exidia glandulosa HHB12029 TaxID=1314781 RepID=A0A165AYY7_EXIGL|nr:hypothetical protein EXIGLDRAFT_464094 [Exidia glandulosa HHB12029]